MSKYINMFVTVLCINLMLVLGGVIPFEGSLTSHFFTAPNNDLIQGISLAQAFENTTRSISSQSGGATTGLGFIDGIKMLLGIFSFIIDTLTAPIQILFNPALDLPVVFRILVGVPLTITYIFSAIFLLRGNE